MGHFKRVFPIPLQQELETASVTTKGASAVTFTWFKHLFPAVPQRTASVVWMTFGRDRPKQLGHLSSSCPDAPTCFPWLISLTWIMASTRWLQQWGGAQTPLISFLLIQLNSV